MEQCSSTFLLAKQKPGVCFVFYFVVAAFAIVDSDVDIVEGYMPACKGRQPGLLDYMKKVFILIIEWETHPKEEKQKYSEGRK